MDQSSLRCYYLFFEHEGGYIYNHVTHLIERDFDALERLDKEVLNLVIQMIAISEENLALKNKEYEYDANIFNNNICKRCEQLSSVLTCKELKKLNDECVKKSSNQMNIDVIFEDAFKKCKNFLLKECFRYMLKGPFERGGWGKDFGNNFIDITNIGLLELYNCDEAIYMTSDLRWKNILLNNCNNPFLSETINFYKKFSK